MGGWSVAGWRGAMALGLGAALGAQEPESASSLASLRELMHVRVITATRTAQDATEVPATVLVVTQEEIRVRGYRSLLDVFRDLPDFKVEYNGDWEWMNDFAVRGVAGHDKFMILMDGVRISGPTNEQLPILENYPVHLAQQIEIIYGPGSALYGPDAVSGVVNIITRKSGAREATLESGRDGQRFFNVFWNQPFGEHDSWTLAGQGAEDDQPLGDLARNWGDYRAFESHRTGLFHTYLGDKSPVGPYSTDPAAPIKTKALYASLQVGAFSLFAFHNEARIPSASANTPDNSLYNEDTFLSHGLTVWGARFTQEVGVFGFQTTLDAAQYALDPQSRYRNVHSDFVPGYKYAQSDTFRLEQQVNWSGWEPLSVVGGASFEKIDAIPWTIELAAPVDRSKAISGLLRGTPIEADIYRLDYHHVAAFLQAQVDLAKGLRATVGARYDTNSRYGSTFNPRLGLVWERPGLGTFKVLYGEAVLAPSPYAAFASFGGLASSDGGLTYHGQFIRLPNPGLKPIESSTYELGFQSDLGERWGFSVSAFRIDLDHLYNVDTDTGPGKTNLYPQKTYKGWPVDYIEVRINQGRQHNQGGTLKVDYKVRRARGRSVSLYAALSYVDGRVDPSEQGRFVEIDRIAPFILRLGGDLQMGPASLALSWTRVGTQRLPAFVQGSDRRYTLPGYGTANAHARYQVGPVAFTATVSNLFNSRYRNLTAFSDPYGNSAQFTGAPQYGRRFLLGLSARF